MTVQAPPRRSPAASPVVADDDLFPEPEAAPATMSRAQAGTYAPVPRAPRAAPKFIVQALLDDFPITVEFSGTAETLQATVERLRAIGAVPPTPAARAAVAQERAREAPVCPYHGPMKESTKAPGTYYCSARMGDNTFCKQRWPEK